MAKAKPRSRAPQARSAQPIERLVFVDRLRGPILPGVLGGVAALVWVLSNAGVIPSAPAVTAVAALVLALGLFFGLRDFLDPSSAASRGAALAGFAALWAAGTFYPIYVSVNPEPPIAVRDLSPNDPPFDVPLAGAKGPYRVVVEGHLKQTQGQTSQTVQYQITAERSGAPAQVLAGEFKESWGTRRLGRRGTAPVHIVRSMDRHIVDSPGGEDLKIKLDRLVPGDAGSVTVRVHPDPFPALPFAVLGVVLTAAAYVVDTWRTSERNDGLMTVLTLCALLGVVAFRHFAPAQPGLGDLLFNGAVGAVAGWAGGAVLWRATRGLRRRLA